ncbi:MAG: GH3 auxin-responsive promoter family protein [Chloroflexota bacterium]
MPEIATLLRQGKTEELWQKCCGFIDLDIEEVMAIQHRLLLEQLELLKKCELGRYLLNGTNPHNTDEFRRKVPLTVYDDYAPYFLNKRENALPRKPALWQYTSGKSGEYDYRWVPVTQEQLKQIEPLLFALFLFAGCSQRKEIALKEHDRILYAMAPPPYATGTMTRVFPYKLFNFLPAVDDAEHMSFEDRMNHGFKMALSDGLDACFALSSVAVAIGDRFGQKSHNSGAKGMLKTPKALPRVMKGLMKSKMAHRPLLPRDLWSLKCLITFGIDSSIYREKIREIWGREPLEFHGCTEAVLLATQTWDRQGMTFVPHLNFFEFITEEDSMRSRENPAYQPSTLLLDELKPGNYELVITSFQGGPFVRYRLGHLVKITSLRNEQLGIDIPQMVFLTRVDDQIDIAGFTRLSEKVIWQAIENTGLAYQNWVACKETKGKPALHLYIELKQNGVSPEQVANSIHNELKKLDTPYAELESFTGLRALETTLLPPDAFRLYGERQRAAGADLSQLKPPHINPSPEAVDYLVNADKTAQEIEKQIRV